MSEASEGFIKPEAEMVDVKDTTLLTNIPMDETIDLQHAVVIMPENSDGNLSINTVQDSNVVVLASMTSNGELITPDMNPTTEPEPGTSEAQAEQTEEVPEEPRDPNTCSHCNKVFRSQTVS